MKLGLILLNKKMKLQLEIRYLEKVLGNCNGSIIEKIKNFFSKNKYSKLNKELKEKKEYLKFIINYMDNNKDKMDLEVDIDLNKEYKEVKKILAKI